MSSPLQSVHSDAMIKTCMHFTQAQNISFVIVNTYLKKNIDLVQLYRSNQNIGWLLPVKLVSHIRKKRQHRDSILAPLGHDMDSTSRINFSIFHQYLEKKISFNQTVACLYSKNIQGKELDSFSLVSPRRLFPWLAGREKVFRKLLEKISPATLIKLLEVAIKLAEEGKEGKSIGTMFVLAHPKDIKSHSIQLILNPLEGHPERVRNITNPDFFETVRELSSIDGGFVVSHRGVVISAGTYFQTSSRRNKLKKGYGTRHAAAASVTKEVDSIALVLSESSRHISVFYAGRLILEGSFTI